MGSAKYTVGREQSSEGFQNEGLSHRARLGRSNLLEKLHFDQRAAHNGRKFRFVLGPVLTDHPGDFMVVITSCTYTIFTPRTLFVARSQVTTSQRQWVTLRYIL